MSRNLDQPAPGGAPESGVTVESSPNTGGSFVGFVPVAEPIISETLESSDSQSLEDRSTFNISQSGSDVVALDHCKINLREGCYRITFQPKRGTNVFYGTMRVDKSGGQTIISGDLYRFLSPIVSIPTRIAVAASAATRPASTSIFARPLPIPIYARNKYHSYLKVVDIKMPSPTSRCSFTLKTQEYVYTQPSAGSFNGSFPASPGSRTVNLVLSPATPPPGYSSVYFEGKWMEGATDRGTFKMGWVSSYFRRATLEIDTLTGAVPPLPVPALSGSGKEDFKTVFKTAGWNLNVIYDQKEIAFPAGVNSHACWDHSDLHALMTNVRKATTDLDNEWRFHLIVVPATMGCSRGVMYDQLGVPREGSASFSDDGYPNAHSDFFGAAENQMQRNVPRAYLRSACHEVGHGFNQIHQEQEEGADNSIMTTTPSVADVLADAATGDPGVFPDQIKLGFNEHVRHHLTHFPDPAVRPGGMTFGSGHDTMVPQADEDRHYFSAEDLELRLIPSERNVELGEPLRLEWELINNSAEPVPVPSDIRLEAQYAFITVINPHGVSKPMPCFIIECEAASIINLKPQKRLGAETRLFWSSYGFAFERAGRHIIEARVLWSIAGVPFGVRATTDVWVNFPQSNTDNEAAATLLHPEVGKYVALGGGATHLTEAVDRLNAAFNGAGNGGSNTSDGPSKNMPAAIRGFDGLLPGDRAGSGDVLDSERSTTESTGRASRGTSKKSAARKATKTRKAGKATKKATKRRR
ncbi:MAG: hypothetical protein H0W99_03365 [Acidobacteria bacterium]|nr:hypothetical protein [Acidobacteriota bacterium]